MIGHQHMGVRGIALFMSAVVIGGAAGQWPLGWLSDRTDRRRVIVGCCLGAATVAGALTQAPFEAPWMMLALASAWGAFAFSLYAISVAHSNDFAQAGSYVEVSSGLLLLYGIGAVIGPLVVAPLLTRIGPSALFGSTFIVHLLLAAFTVWRICQRAPAPQAQHLSFDESAQAALTLSDAFQQDDADKHEAAKRAP
jgi:MFS family permease